MITRDGHAKILDLGLAKLIERPPMSAADSSEVATAFMPQHSTPGYESKDWSLNRVGVEPWIDNVDSDPRLADLVRRMGLKP